jgi:hypothetical protein
MGILNIGSPTMAPIRRSRIPTQRILVLVCLIEACGGDGAARRQIAAIADVREIQQAQEAYHSKSGVYGSLQDLVKTGAYPAERYEAVILSARRPYQITLNLSGGGYRLSALPTGVRSGPVYSLYTDESKVIRSRFGLEPANADSPRIDGDGTQK